MKAINKIRLEMAYDDWNRGHSSIGNFCRTVMEIVEAEYPTATFEEKMFITRKWDKQFKKN